MNPEREPQENQEQSPEEILGILQEAIEKRLEVTLTVLNSDGSLTDGNAIPLVIDRKYLDIEEMEYGMSN